MNQKTSHEATMKLAKDLKVEKMLNEILWTIKFKQMV